MADSWCEPDDCPAAICNGPHYEHLCVGYIVTMRRNQTCASCDRTGEQIAADGDERKKA